MAIANDGFFGPGRGKIGNLVYYVRKGKNVVRKIGRNDAEPSEAQLRSRMEMKVATAFSKKVLPFIQYGFAMQIEGTDLSQMNVSVSYNKKNALKGSYPEISIDYPKALLSEGPLLQAEQAEVVRVPEGLRFSWHVVEDLPWPDNTDQAMVLAYFPESDKTVYKLFGAERSVGVSILEISEPMQGDYMETYISFISADRKQVSTSIYAGALNAPQAEDQNEGDAAGQEE